MLTLQPDRIMYFHPSSQGRSYANRMPTVAIILTEADRQHLKSIARWSRTAPQLGRRASIVRRCAAGQNNKTVARCLRVSPATVGKWRARFARGWVDGLLNDPRSGTPCTVRDARFEQVVITTLETTAAARDAPVLPLARAGDRPQSHDRPSHPADLGVASPLHSEARRMELDAQLVAVADTDPYREPVGWLRCFRAIDTLTAVLLLAELHDVQRFPPARTLMAYLGLVPGEHSSGDCHRHGPITKTGSSLARRLVVEAAWRYRHGPGSAGPSPSGAAGSLPSQSSGRRNQGVSAIANGHRLVNCPQATTGLVDHRCHHDVLLNNSRFQIQVRLHAASVAGTPQRQ